MGFGRLSRGERRIRNGNQMPRSNMPEPGFVLTNCRGQDSSSCFNSSTEAHSQRQPRQVSPRAIAVASQINSFLLRTEVQNFQSPQSVLPSRRSHSISETHFAQGSRTYFIRFSRVCYNSLISLPFNCEAVIIICNSCHSF